MLLGFPASAGAQVASSITLSGVTLRECFQWAEASSESLAIKREDVAQSKARARATLAGALPRVSWEFSDTYQDPKGVDTLIGRGFTGFVEKNQAESRFMFGQPVFSGLKEFSAWSGLRRESARDALRLRRGSDELYIEVAERFYGVLADETERANTNAALELAENRVKELSGFYRLGKARESEVFAAKARAAGLHGTLAQVESRIRASREELSRLAHRDMEGVSLQDLVSFPPAAPSLEDVLAKAAGRPDVAAQREDLEGRKWRVRYERGSYWPSIDLGGSYYTKRATFLKEIKWDLRLGVSVPLFAGGRTPANVDAALAAQRQSEAILSELERRAFSGIRTLHRDVLGAIDEGRALEDAAQAAKQGYDAILKEYKLGLATNLEVLTALDALQLQTSARDAARYKAKRLFARLMVELEKTP